MNRRRFLANTAVASVGGFSKLSLHVPEVVAAPKSSKPMINSGRTVTLAAQPAPISFDTNKAAVIVVDMQNDFGTRGGMFDRAGIDISMIQRAVAPTAKVLAASRKAGIKVIYLKMAFLPDLSDMGPKDSPNWRDHHFSHVGDTVQAPSGAKSRILIRDTWNSDIVPELKAEPGDIVIYKHRFSGFYATDLHDTLQRLGARYLIVTGCTTSVCVESTIRDAMFRDYSPILLSDCTGEPIGHNFARSNYEASLLLVQTMFGWSSTSEEFISLLEWGVQPA